MGAIPLNAVVSKDGFASSLMETVVVETAKSLACILFMMGSLLNDGVLLSMGPASFNWFLIRKHHALKQSDRKNKGPCDAEDDEDGDDDADDQDGNDDDDQNDLSGEEGNKQGDGAPENEPQANGDGASEDEEEEDDEEEEEEDDDDSDDGDEEGEEEEEEEEDEDEEEEEEEDEAPQPPTKRRK